MPRRRNNPADLWLPSRVYRGRKSYEFHPKSGGSVRLHPIRRDQQGNLVETDQVKRAVIQAKLKAESSFIQREDIDWLFDLYTKSPQFAKLAFKTRQEDEIRLRRLRLVFGSMLPRKVTSGHIRQYMDTVGETAPASANRDHGFLSRVYSWAKERNIVNDNPTRDVKKFEEKPRDRYVEDWEYDLLYQIALTTSYPWIAPMMEFAYLCRMRSQEIRSLATDRHLLPEGIFVERGKGSANEITLWSERLKDAVSLAEKLLGKGSQTENIPLFPARSGGFIGKSAFSSAWRRVRAKAMEEGMVLNGDLVILKESFNFHDLKAKGVTDHETKASGHKSKKMQAIYDRKPTMTKATR